MDLKLNPITPEERKYTYAQSHQLSMQTGFIGHLRADMDTTGDGFYSTFFDYQPSLKLDEFKVEFDDLINSLRLEGQLLHNRATLSQHCFRNPESSYENDRSEYGFRVDTDKYTYLMRVTPNKGEYNLYCYCYVKEWLDNHLTRAQRGIRFITPDYEDLFRIQDGGQIRITTLSGEIRDRTCRYIDEYHMELSGLNGTNLFHICEFAEVTEAGGSYVAPLYTTLPDMCYSILDTTGEIIKITRGEKGYVLVGNFENDGSPRQMVNRANKNLGVTLAQESAMVAGSMFGWHVPAADPRNYNSYGDPIKPKQKDRGDAR